jgi:LmbE family N-acetylglucosaminyl deacetylase
MTTTASHAPTDTEPSIPRQRGPAGTTRTLVFVGAHPDDDTFTLSGTIALLREDPALRFVLVLATDGEAGEIADDVAIARPALGAHRRDEDAASWQTVGRAPDRTVWLGLPDGGLDRMPRTLLAARIATVLREERPDVVATFGPDGLTGHADHVAVGAATTSAFLDLARDGGPGLRRLLHAGIPQSRFDAWNDDLAAAGLPSWDPTQPYHFRPIPDATVGVEVDCADVADARVAGMRAHRSQWSYTTVPSAADGPLSRCLARESWVLAWPPRVTQSTPTAHVFVGLSTQSGRAPSTAAHSASPVGVVRITAGSCCCSRCSPSSSSASCSSPAR